MQRSCRRRRRAEGTAPPARRGGAGGGAGRGPGGYGQGPPSARASGFFCFFIDLKRNCNIRKCDFGPKSRQKLFRIFNRIQHQGSETFKLPYYGTRPSRCPTVTSLERLLAINQKLPLACVLLSHISDISALLVHVVLILESNFRAWAGATGH